MIQDVGAREGGSQRRGVADVPVDALHVETPERAIALVDHDTHAAFPEQELSHEVGPDVPCRPGDDDEHRYPTGRHGTRRLRSRPCR